MNSLRTQDPWGLLNQFYRDVEQLFGRTGLSSTGDSAVATSHWIPNVDIQEETDQFVIEADIPGVDPKEIEISMEAGILTIKGERKSEYEEEEYLYKRVERSMGNFYRRFSLPHSVDAEKIVATGKHGVLKICIPKKSVTPSRRVQVQGE